MDQQSIGNKLRKLRNQNNLSVQDVAVLLHKYGIYISTKALYSYETGARSVEAPIFLALCMIYRCDNILKEFADCDYAVTVSSSEELRLLERIRGLDEHGQELLNGMLELELKRCRKG